MPTPVALDLKVDTLGLGGVNVDKDPLELEDNELLRAQNATKEARSGRSALVKRPGLIAFNAETAAGAVLGGIGVPLADSSGSSTRTLYIGRASS